MTSALTPREAQIPLPHDPAIAGRTPTPESAQAKLVALRNLLWLVAYLAIMRLLGYRIPRPPARAAARPSPRANPVAAPPATPPARRPTNHRVIDRAYCLDLLAGISGAFANSRPTAAVPGNAEPTQPEPAPRSRRAAPSRHPSPAAPLHHGLAGPRLSPRNRPAEHPPPRQKAAPPRTQTHAHFVAIS